VILFLALMLAAVLLTAVALVAGYVAMVARLPARPTQLLAPLPAPAASERWTALDDQQLARFLAEP
jgi:hypothetical protein